MSLRGYRDQPHGRRRRGAHQRGPSSRTSNFDAAQRGGSAGNSIKDWAQLENDLQILDRQPYAERTAFRSKPDIFESHERLLLNWSEQEAYEIAGAYNRIRGRYQHLKEPEFALHVDHIQGDPYAPPSRVRAVMPWVKSGFPQEYLASDIHKIALCDFITRDAATSIRANSLDRNLGYGKGGWSRPKGGAFNINSCGQEILPRTSALISASGDMIELRFFVSLPAAGRSIMGGEAFQILGVNLVSLVRDSMIHDNLDASKLQSHVECALQQHHLRGQAEANGLVAFIANGSILPRASGASQLPMNSGSAIPMKSPKGLEVTLPLPNGKSIVGLGIPRGVTLLTGGGFHGKSTLLNAIEHGVYNQIPSDGRELVVTDPSAMKVRAEDGRSIAKVDISPFISNLPGGQDTTAFTTEDASGSTSMAANIQEALEAGCRTLLIDEDSSATNLLVRDQRMQGLIRHEPITPLIAKARALFTQHGVSTVIVIGGLGDWLSIADNIIAMEQYLPRSIKQEAEAVINEFPSVVTQSETYGSIPNRSFRIDLAGLREPFAPRKSFITMNRQERDFVDDPALAEAGVDLGGLDQLVEVGQARTLALLIQRVAALTMVAKRGLTFGEIVASPSIRCAVDVSRCLSTDFDGGSLVAVRPVEFLAAVSRIRGMVLRADK